nr:elongation factor P maturation arginine rhamnosyltransferase EarP [Caldimonas sp.]
MQWDLYCRVVDNFGDVGVAWRLAADLAGRGESVRLAVDDASALAWLAPRGAPRVEVVAWDQRPSAAPDVVVELFGVGRPRAAWPAGARTPVLVNVEHLTAERYAERSHALPSPTSRPGEPETTTWFYFPGFTPQSGGLLREPGLIEQRRAFGDGAAWLASLGIATRPGERRVVLFSYRNDAIDALLDVLAAAPTLLLATPGPAIEQVAARLGAPLARGALRAVALPWLAQVDFDRLLWSSDLNLVRGEDSFVRAIWAGAPFLWQLYVQDDGAQRAKLDAFLDRYLARADEPLAAAIRSAFLRWNGAPAGSLAALGDAAVAAAWSAHALAWRDALASQSDLATRLLAFVEGKR